MQLCFLPALCVYTCFERPMCVVMGCHHYFRAAAPYIEGYQGYWDRDKNGFNFWHGRRGPFRVNLGNLLPPRGLGVYFLGAWGPDGGQLWPLGRQICPNGARGPPWPLAGQKMRAHGHKMGRAHQTKPVAPFAATPGAWGLQNCGPNLKLLRPPGPSPGPGGWPTAIFLGRWPALQKATGTFSTTPGAWGCSF